MRHKWHKKKRKRKPNFIECELSDTIKVLAGKKEDDVICRIWKHNCKNKKQKNGVELLEVRDAEEIANQLRRNFNDV